MMPRLSQLCASSHRAGAISRQLQRCPGCLSSARQAIVLTPDLSICDDATTVSAVRVKPSSC
ncbi:hypothetical protein OAO87_03795 [bacterium]|nr:hypothetical protein [bacterium]